MSDKFMKKLEEMLIMESDFENLPDLAVDRRDRVLDLPQNEEEVRGYLQRLDVILSNPLRVDKDGRASGKPRYARELLNKLLSGEKMGTDEIYFLGSIPNLIDAEERTLSNVDPEKMQRATEIVQSRDRSREAAEYNRQFDNLQESLLGLKAAIKKATPAQKRKYLKMLKELKNG